MFRKLLIGQSWKSPPALTDVLSAWTLNQKPAPCRRYYWDSFAYRLRDSPEQQSRTCYTGPCETNCMVWSAAPLGWRNRIWMCVIQFHTQNIVAKREHDNRCCERRTTLFIRWWGWSLTQDGSLPHIIFADLLRLCLAQSICTFSAE